MTICTERKVKIDGIGNTSKSKPLADADKAAVLRNSPMHVQTTFAVK